LADKPSARTPFGDFFNNGFVHNRCNGLLDRRAQIMFEMLKQACNSGVYPWQRELEGPPGRVAMVEGREMIMLSSYDYLGLIGDPRVNAAAVEAIQTYGTGTGGVRMLTGTIDLHHVLERELAKFKGIEAAIVFSSGYVANLAVIAALMTPADKVVIDALAHRSLVDACLLAGVPFRRFRHNDPESLREALQTAPAGRRTLIIADGVYSMDGDACLLPELIAVKKEFGCHLLVDDSHSFGVLGRTGRGVDEYYGCNPRDVDIWTASLAKAIPSNGGFVGLSREISIFVQHAAAPFIFSAALCPSAVAAIRAAMSILDREPERVARLQRNSGMLRDGLRDAGYEVGKSCSAVIPVMLEDESQAALLTRSLLDNGIYVVPIIYPAVPRGSARIRLCATAAHTEADLAYAIGVFRQLRASI
jgi:8-amino-7-oxononanoate synthase